MRRDAKVVPNKGSVPVGLIQGAIKYSKGPIRFSDACFEKTRGQHYWHYMQTG